MAIVSLLARVSLGALLTYRDVKFLDPFSRHVSIGSLRRAGVEGFHLTFVSAGLMMLIGGLCIVTGAGVGVATAIALLIFSALATHRFWRVDGHRFTRETHEQRPLCTQHPPGGRSSAHVADSEAVVAFDDRLT